MLRQSVLWVCWGLFCLSTFERAFLPIYICKRLFCLSTFLWGFSAFIILQIAFLPMYIWKRFFCLYIFAQLFCPYTFVNGFSTFIHLQTTFLPICICKGLFYSFTFAKGFSAHCQVFCNQSQIQTPFKAFLVTHWISGCQSSTASHTVSHNWPWLRSGKSISLTNCTLHSALCQQWRCNSNLLHVAWIQYCYCILESDTVKAAMWGPL